MTLFELENLHPFFNSLGWTLLHFLWQGIVIAIMTRLIVAVLQKQSANLRYLVMCGALLLMLLSPIFTFSLINKGEFYLNADETLLIKESPEFSPQNKTIKVSPTVFKPESVNKELEQKNKLFFLARVETAFPWLIVLWLLGVLTLSVRLMVDWLSLLRLRGQATRHLIELQPIVERLSRQLGINKTVQLLESSSIKVPLAAGWFKPIVLLPVALVFNLTPQQLESVIAHELAHIRRHDYVVNILQTIAEILLFYHPAVLWLSKQIRIEREYACDDLVIAAGGADALVYARALTKVEKLRQRIPIFASAATGGSLESRVRRLVDESYRHNSTNGFSGALIFLTVFAAVIIGWQTAFPRKSADFPKNNPEVSARDNDYLNDDNLTKAKSDLNPENTESFAGEDKFLRDTALNALGQHRGTVIIMNPNTGRLYTIVNQDWAFREGWNPASIFKIITSLAALNENKVTTDEKIVVPDFSKGLMLNDAIAISKNEYFDVLGKRVGVDKLLSYARDFGLGEMTGVNLPGESAGYLPPNSIDIDAGRLGRYGQEAKITPMQLAVLVSALANNGKLIVPFAGEKEKSPNVRRSINASSDSISQIIRGMQSAVVKGTAKGAFNESFDVAGKTGTMKVGNDDTGLFASFAPVEKPKFVVVVALKESETNGLKAAEIAGQIYRNIGSDYSLDN